MSSIFGFVIGLLQAALSLIGFVQVHPDLPQAQKDQAQVVAEQAITQATQALASQSKSSSDSNPKNLGKGMYATPISGTAPLAVTIYPNNPSGTFIDFGDGTNTNSASNGCSGVSQDGCPINGTGTVTHTYASAGTYTIKLWRSMPSTVLDSVTITVTAEAQATISVPGMSKYTDTDFGFSFWYPSGWQVSYSNIGGAYSLNDAAGHIKLTIEKIAEDTPSIDLPNEYYGDIRYFFDANTHTWMATFTKAPTGAPDKTTPADVSINTMGGLHMLNGNARFGAATLVPLSARHFLLVVTGDPGGYLSQTPLVQTILATDPSVATPVSAAEQTATIQAEKSAYSTN